MITTIVFDMGNVLGDYNPWYVLEEYAKDKQDGQLLYDTIFKSPEWLMRDEGLLERAEAETIWLSRLPERLHETATKVCRDWHLYMPNFDDMTALVKALHENGYRIYLLSNTSDYYEEFSKSLHALKYMDGAIVSYREKVMKPNAGIYQALFNTYGLRPEECYFVDDAPLNIQGAKAVGMVGFCYRQDTEELKANMRLEGIRI